MIERNSALIVFGRLFTSYGYYLVIPFLMVYITKYLGMSAIDAGILLAILNLSRRGLGILAGYWSDKFGSRNMILLGLALEVFAYLTMSWVKNFWLLAIIIFLSGAGGCLYNISSRSILAKAREGQNTAVAFGFFYITMHIGALLGPLTYIWFSEKGILPLTFFLSAGVYGIFLVLSLIWLNPVNEDKKISAIKPRDMLIVFSSRPFMIYCSLITGAWFILNQLYVVLPLYLLNVSNGEQLIAYLNAWNAILIIIIQYWCSRIVGRLSLSTKFTFLAVGVLLMGIGWLFCVSQTKPMLYFAISLFTMGEILFIGVVDLLAVTFAPPGQSGLYLGFATFTWAIGGALASIAGTTFYSLASSIHHLEWFWLSLLIMSFLLSIFVLLSKTRLVDSLNKLPLLQVS